MSNELLTPAEMAHLDRLAIGAGPFDGYGLMRNAGRAVSAEILRRFPGVGHVDVLCGPGNNGGDGYVIARLLREDGLSVAVWAEASPRAGTDAFRALDDCPIAPGRLSDFRPRPNTLVVDALYGAGLSKPMTGAAAEAAGRASEARLPVVAVDLPSGVSGETGRVLGIAFDAAMTVTFVRKKPGHLLQPGRSKCGEVVVADIGIGEAMMSSMQAWLFENGPELWRGQLPRPAVDAHKYSRGHVAVMSGGATSTGAARLAALAAARSGAGAVTVLSPAEALAVNAAHLTSIMLRRADGQEEIAAFIEERRATALVFGPGLSPEVETARLLAALLEGGGHPLPAVIDASAITALAKEPGALAAIRGASLVITPHDGEFARLFPKLAADKALSKVDSARQAAQAVQAVVVHKGPDTVIAAPDGRAAINANGTAWLATAGSGDVLAGLIGGLLGQGMPAFEAACAAVWMHAEAAADFGPGLIAEDLPPALVPVVRDLLGP